jgi:hypothetical protein
LVEFYSGPINPADQIGTGTLSLSSGKYQATFSTSLLAASASPYSITAVYQGDSVVEGSTSNSLALTVNPDQTTTTSSTTSAAPSFGQSVTLTASVAAKAPGSGLPPGSVDFYDTTTATDLGSVTLGSGTASLTLSTLPLGNQVITETYSGNSNYMTSGTSLSESVVVSVYVLNNSALAPAITGTLYLSSSSTIDIPGVVVVDSPAKPALTLAGTSSLTASSVGVVGTVSKASTSTISPAPTTGISAVADPLAALPVPSVTGSATSVSLTSGTKTINPGIYSGIAVSGTGTTLTMNPGIYVIEGGGLSVTGSANISGNGVVIYNANTLYPSSGGTYGGITLNTTGSINLSAPTTGVYASILFFEARSDSSAINISGSSALGLTGVIYASDALLSIAGSAQITDALDVNRLQLSNSAAVLAPTAGGAAVVTAHGGAAGVTAVGTAIGSSTSIVSLPTGSQTGVASSSTTSDATAVSLAVPTQPITQASIATSAGSNSTETAASSADLTILLMPSTATGLDDGSGVVLTDVEAFVDDVGLVVQADTESTLTERSDSMDGVPVMATSIFADAGDSSRSIDPASRLPKTPREASDHGTQASRPVIKMRRETIKALDWVLEELVAERMLVNGINEHGAGETASGPIVAIGGEGTSGQLAAVPKPPGAAAVPSGPISRRDRQGRSDRSDEPDLDLFLVGGFCGLGAATAAGNKGLGGASSRRPFLKFKKPRFF